ncbi:AAA family ATPase [Amycolatopsis panacis]|uniref:LuxR family transcriptional regulator n=1 Tax=Amycolatopsis panacis TaxID=2340917 RepID=A0A419HKG4_9PSEU|nr:LuxR family transcriptional regulator [Amycolatopsis panacis]RJQ76178.1 LuxR family transcriptional regulator [Amycolatopsis panacis]
MMIERWEQLAILGRTAEQVKAGTGRFVLVRGGAGAGRSALVHAAGEEAAARGLRVAQAVSGPLERHCAYGALRQLLEPVLGPGSAVELPPEIRGGPSEPSEVDDQSRREHLVLHEVFGLLAEAVAEAGPVALLVDDLQWADPGSLRWLAYLANRLRGLRVMVVATLLDGDGAADETVLKDIAAAATAVLETPRLSLGGVRAFLAGRWGITPDEDLTGACHDLTGGIPVLLDALAGSGTPPIASAAELSALRLPAASARLARCLRTQPDRVTAMARAMAILGPGAEPGEVAELAALDLPDFDAAERVLRRLGLMADHPGGGPLRFTGSVLGELIADRMSAGEQDELHLRAAAVLYRRGAPVAQVARQLLESSAGSAPWAVEVLRTAATAAMTESAPRTAARYLRHALAHPGADRARLLVDLAAVERSYDLPACSRHVHQALLLLPDPAARATALTLVPPLIERRYVPDPRRMRAVLTELGESTAREPEDRDLALLLEARLRVVDPAGILLVPAEERLRMLDRGEALGSPGARELLTTLLYWAGVAGAVPRDTVVELAHQVLAREPASPDRMYTTLPLLVPVLAAADALSGVASWLGGVTGRERAQPDLPAVVGWAGEALTAYGTGALDRARERAEAVLAVGNLRLAGVHTQCLCVLAEVAVELRDCGLAREVVRGCGPEQPPWLKSQAQGALAFTSGNPTAALEYFGDCARQLDRSGLATAMVTPSVRSKLAVLLAMTEQKEQAEVVAKEIVAEAVAWGAPSAIGRALRVRASLMDRDEQAVPLLREAVGVLESSGNRLELAKALLLLGERDAGTPDAQCCLARGRRIAAECGASRLGSDPAVAPEGGPGAVLTAAERRVVDLVVEGRRNKDIAELLEVSVRAVEKHLTSSYRKLGITGRAQLARAVEGEGEGYRAG